MNPKYVDNNDRNNNLEDGEKGVGEQNVYDRLKQAVSIARQQQASSCRLSHFDLNPFK